ncbi:hypothetical protein C8E05_0712 [Rhodococcus wratislaviensis]|uniref:Secreted protein n=2 Tax=Rhodococcus TaxID=1827 RepID=A0AB38FQI5_RHOWR|nr:hypothetical protein EP51_05120 [Rhodococcus opacus]REE71359.1 hypothetical protein C8E05_0712 [Rhodococcus wratislaviensis]SPZ43312.1 Uncharacterised protein [Rhodococcus wratislaviensis]
MLAAVEVIVLICVWKRPRGFHDGVYSPSDQLTCWVKLSIRQPSDVRVEFAVSQGQKARSPRMCGVSIETAGPDPVGAIL